MLTRQPRIVVVLDVFPQASETFLYTLFTNLRSSGIELSIVARRRGHSPHRPEWAGSVRYLPCVGSPRALRAATAILLGIALSIWRPRTALRFWGVLRRGGWRRGEFIQQILLGVPVLLSRPDVVYLPFGGLAVKMLSLVRTHSGCVVSLRGSDVRVEPLLNERYRDQLKEVLQRAAAIHCVSEATRSEAEAVAGTALPKAMVVRTSLAAAFRGTGPAARAADGTLRIVSVGRLDWKKGLEHGLMAIAELRRRGIACRWSIAGEGPMRIALEWAIRDEGLTGIVSLEGALDSEGVRQLMASSDVAFLPSVSEGISNAAIEAMAVGLPLVSTTAGGMVEAVPDDYPFLTPPRDWRAMADAIERLAADPVFRSDLGAKLRSFVAQRFSGEQQAGAFARLLTTAAEASR